MTLPFPENSGLDALLDDNAFPLDAFFPAGEAPLCSVSSAELGLGMAFFEDAPCAAWPSDDGAVPCTPEPSSEGTAPSPMYDAAHGLAVAASPAQPVAAAAPSSAVALENNKTALDARWPRDLIEMDQAEFRRYTRDNRMDPSDLKELKQARRRFRNRIYAKTARLKKVAKDSTLKTHHAELEQHVAAQHDEVAKLHAENNRMALRLRQYEALLLQYASLSAADIERLLSATSS